MHSLFYTVCFRISHFEICENLILKISNFVLTKIQLCAIMGLGIYARKRIFENLKVRNAHEE